MSAPCTPGPISNSSQTSVDVGFQLTLDLPSLVGVHTAYENLSYDLDTLVSARAGFCGTPTQADFSCGVYSEGDIQIFLSLQDLTAKKILGTSPQRLNVRSIGYYASCWGGLCSNLSGVQNAGPLDYSGHVSSSWKQTFRATDLYAVGIEFVIQLETWMVGYNDLLRGHPAANASVTPGPSGVAVTVHPPGAA